MYIWIAACGFQNCMSFNTGYSYTRGLVYPVTGIVLHFGCFHVTVGSALLAANIFYRDSGSTLFAQCVAVNFRFLLTVFKESAGNVSFDSPGHVASDKHVIPSASNFITSESTGSD